MRVCLWLWWVPPPHDLSFPGFRSAFLLRADCHILSLSRKKYWENRENALHAY